MANSVLGPRAWSVDEINILKDLADKKHTSTEIAKLLGRTRNAVMGAAFRMGISLNKKNPSTKATIAPVVKVVELKPKPTVREKPVQSVVIPMPKPPPKVELPTPEREDTEPESRGILFVNRERNQCAYILGPVAAEKTRCCGELVYKGSSWCAEHKAVVWVPMGKRGAASNGHRHGTGPRTWLFGGAAKGNGR